MIVEGMGKSVLSFIPLTTIPLTSLRPFPSSILASVAAGRAVHLRLPEANQPKCLSMNHLHTKSRFVAFKPTQA